MDEIIDTSFVRKDFYVNPPAKNASPDAWADWLKADRQEAINAKRAHTRASKTQPAELPEALVQGHVVKVGGVYRQSILTGFTGSAEEGTLGMDVVDPRANPHRDVSLVQMESERHTRTQRKSGSAKRKARKEFVAARRAKQSQ